MTFSDPVANMLTIIRNANLRNYKTVIFPYSSLKWSICEKLADKKLRFLSQCWIDKKIEKKWKIKADIGRINYLKKISKPSQHIHLKAKDIKKYCRKYGVYLFSTSFPDKPIMSHWEALEKNIGGKLIFHIS